MHCVFSIRDEALMRENFMIESTLHDLKDSLQTTLDSLPEALVVKKRSRLLYFNQAFAKLLGKPMVDAYDAIRAFKEQKISISLPADESNEEVELESDLHTQMENVENTVKAGRNKRTHIKVKEQQLWHEGR